MSQAPVRPVSQLDTGAAAAGPRPLLSSARARFSLVAGVLVLGVLFLFAGDSWLSVLNSVMIYALAALGLNVLSGYAGQISLGISFFMGLGAYVAAWLGGGPPVFPGDPSGLSLPFVIWLPAAALAAALAGALIGPTALRLKGFYLGIVTLTLVFIGQYLFNNVTRITGGPQGRAVPSPGFGDFSFSSPTPVFGLQLDQQQWWFLLLALALALAGLFVANVARSRAGRSWQAVRDNEVAASIMGINLFTTKMGAFIFSSFLAGLAGAFLASYTGFTVPTTWSGGNGLVLLSIPLVAAILIGGVASVWGSILGAAFVFGLPAVLANLPETTNSTGFQALTNNLNQVLFGLFIVIFLLFEPAGLIGVIRRVQFLIRRREARPKGGEVAPTLAVTAPDSQFEVEISSLPQRTQAPLPGE